MGYYEQQKRRKKISNKPFEVKTLGKVEKKDTKVQKFTKPKDQKRRKKIMSDQIYIAYQTRLIEGLRQKCEYICRKKKSEGIFL